jgi:hypothetical protein
VDGACSSSLLAIDAAATKLAAGQVDAVIAGGVDISLASGARPSVPFPVIQPACLLLESKSCRSLLTKSRRILLAFHVVFHCLSVLDLCTCLVLLLCGWRLDNRQTESVSAFAAVPSKLAQSLQSARRAANWCHAHPCFFQECIAGTAACQAVSSRIVPDTISVLHMCRTPLSW